MHQAHKVCLIPVPRHGCGTSSSESIDPATIALPASPEPDTNPSISLPDYPLSQAGSVSPCGTRNESLPKRSEQKDKHSPDQARQYDRLILRLANSAPHLHPLGYLTDHKRHLGSLSVLNIPKTGQISTKPVTEVDVGSLKTDEIGDVVRSHLEAISSTSHQRVILIEDISYITPSILQQCFDGCLPNPGSLADHLSTSRNQSHDPMSVQKMRALGGRHSSIRWWRPYRRAAFPPHLNEKRWQVLLDSGSCRWQTRPQAAEGRATSQTNNVTQHSFDIDTNVRRDEWYPFGSGSQQADLAAWEEKATIYVVDPPDKLKLCM